MDTYRGRRLVCSCCCKQHLLTCIIMGMQHRNKPTIQWFMVRPWALHQRVPWWIFHHTPRQPWCLLAIGRNGSLCLQCLLSGEHLFAPVPSNCCSLVWSFQDRLQIAWDLNVCYLWLMFLYNCVSGCVEVISTDLKRAGNLQQGFLVEVALFVMPRSHTWSWQCEGPWSVKFRHDSV